MKKILGLILLAFPVFAAPLFAQRTVIFPRFASGNGWTSEFFFANQGISTVSDIVVSFYDENGNSLTVQSDLFTDSSYTFSLAGGATQVIHVTSGSTFMQGYVMVQYPSFDSPVRGSQVYRYAQNGVVQVEVGIPQQEQGNNFSFPVEINKSQTIYTAVAFTNPITTAQTLVVNLINSDGSINSTATVPLAAGQHLAGFIDQDWLFPGLKDLDFAGTISVSSPLGVGVLTLRQDNQAFGAVSTDGGPIIGPFALSSTPIPEVEPNDMNSTAQQITGSKIVSGTINPASDADVFTFSGKRNQIITIICDTQGQNSLLDSFLAVYDSNLNMIANNDQNGLAPGGYPQNDSFIQMVLPADGIYYVMVWDYMNGGGANYTYNLHFNLP